MNRGKNVEPILSGQKILNIKYNDYIQFIDSLNYLPMALSSFNKAFGLNSDVYGCKGFSPYMFNTKANWNYEGSVPSVEYFDLSRFNKEKQKEFFEWHNTLTTKNYVYNQRNELIKYCLQDVRLLQAGCLRFMNDILNLTGVNPFHQCITLSQLVLCIFRKKFMKPNSLGISPPNGYTSNQNQSVIGKKWLLYKKKTVDPDIDFEVRLQPSGILVDGYSQTTQTCYEFNGCWWHGHSCIQNISPKSYVQSAYSKHKLLERCESTKYKLKRLTDLKYTVVTEWECVFKEFLKTNPEINNKINAYSEIIYEPLELRDAVCRVESFCVYHKAKQNQRIRYLDFCSMYPFTMFTKVYCKDNPIRITRGMECPTDITSLHGIFKGRVVAPKSLFMPLLPFRVNKKLFFTLCASCSIKNQITLCEHNEFERSMYGTWCLVEIREAVIKYKYKILETTEIWEYETEQYSSETKTGGLFSNYMKCFLKLKQEASGYPSPCTTDEDKKNYILEFAKNNGIEMDPDRISVNASYRSLSKLLVNSLW